MAATIPEQHLVIMGSGGVGKTTLIVQFVQHRFVPDYEPTIEDSYRKQLSIDNQTVMLDILDTAGQEEYAALKDQYMLTGEGFFLAYSVLDTHSFNELKVLREQILKVKNASYVPMVIVGNKLDIALKEPQKRQVTAVDGQTFASQFSVPFFETSAKDGTNVEEAWAALVRAARRSAPSAKSAGPVNGASGAKSGGCCTLL